MRHPHRTQPALLSVFGISLLALLVAGCGEPASGAGVPQGTEGLTKVDACHLFTLDDASQALGTTAMHEPSGGPDRVIKKYSERPGVSVSACSYTSGDKSREVTVVVGRAVHKSDLAGMAADTVLDLTGGTVMPAEPVNFAGRAGAAHWGTYESGIGTLIVLMDPYLIAVGVDADDAGPSGSARDLALTVARRVHEKLSNSN